MSMNENPKIEVILQDIDEIFCFVHDLLDKLKLEPSDQYRRINYTYFKMFCCHFESFYILIKNNHFSSAILLMRTMLELFVKSFYFEFIEKEKESSVEEFLIAKKDFPSFFNMARALEEYEHSAFGNFRDSFKQFTKSGLASYTKFSLFSHGRGEILKGFYENNKISYTTEQISDVLLTAKGLFEQFSLFLFFAQDEIDAGRLVLRKIKV